MDPITVAEMVSVVARLQLANLNGVPCSLSSREVEALCMVFELSRRQPEEVSNALQEQQAAEVDVQEQAEDGPSLG